MATIEDAVKAIGPGKIALAVELLRERREFFAVPHAGDLKTRLKAFATALGKAERAGKELPAIMRPGALIARMESHRRGCEAYAAVLKVPAGAKRRDPVKADATVLAHDLLEDSNVPATRSRDGAWHRLANMLYARATGREADLFDYLGADIGPVYDARP